MPLTTKHFGIFSIILIMMFVIPTIHVNAEESSNSGSQKKLDPIELILLFMTPWRNPNSIFVDGLKGFG